MLNLCKCWKVELLRSHMYMQNDFYIISRYIYIYIIFQIKSLNTWMKWSPVCVYIYTASQATDTRSDLAKRNGEHLVRWMICMMITNMRKQIKHLHGNLQPYKARRGILALCRISVEYKKKRFKEMGDWENVTKLKPNVQRWLNKTLE